MCGCGKLASVGTRTTKLQWTQMFSIPACSGGSAHSVSDEKRELTEQKKNLLDLTFIYQMTEGFLHNCDYVPKVGNIHPEVLFLCRYSNSVQMLLLISFKLQLTQSEGNLCAVSFHHHIAY